MTNVKKIEGTEQAWEDGTLGASEEFAAPAPTGMDDAVDLALGLQSISIRLPKQLIDTYKLIGSFHGVGYQPLMRDILQRWAKEGLKEIFEHQSKKSEEAQERLNEMRKVA